MTNLTYEEIQTQRAADEARRFNLDDLAVGDGATFCIHSDNQAGTVIARTPTTITWQRDTATLLNGMNSDADDKLHCSPGGFAGHVSGSQRHDYARNTDGSVTKFSRRVIKLRDGGTKIVYKMKGHGARSPGCQLIRERYEHYDYNF